MDVIDKIIEEENARYQRGLVTSIGNNEGVVFGETKQPPMGMTPVDTGEKRGGPEIERYSHPFRVEVGNSGLIVERGQVFVPQGNDNAFERFVPTMGGTSLKDSADDDGTIPTITGGALIVYLKFVGSLEESGYVVTDVTVESGLTVPADTEMEKYLTIAEITTWNSVNDYIVDQHIRSDFIANWSFGQTGSHPFKLSTDQNNIFIVNGRVNNELISDGPITVGTTLTVYLKTLWTATTEDVANPYSLDGADYQVGNTTIEAAATIPADVLPEINVTTGADTDGEYYIPIGTQTTDGGIKYVENDNVRHSLQIVFCLDGWHQWPAG